MYKYVLKRLLMMIPVLVGVLLIVFTINQMMPGDPAIMLAGGEQATPMEIERVREELGLNDPLPIQFFNYAKGLILEGDLGTSYATKRPVFEEVTERLPTTVTLAVVSILLAVAIGIPTGILSAIRQYSWIDHCSMGVALIGVSMPNFWQGLMNILIFAIYLKWLPASGFYGWQYWILPALTIGTSSAAIITRMTRSSMLEVIRQDYIRTARAKGLSEKVVITKHALKNALIPIITVVGIQFGSLLGGAVVTEHFLGVGADARVARLGQGDLRGLDFEGVRLHRLHAEVVGALSHGRGRQRQDERGRGSVVLQHRDLCSKWAREPRKDAACAARTPRHAMSQTFRRRRVRELVRQRGYRLMVPAVFASDATVPGPI